jgi:urease accessory protein
MGSSIPSDLESYVLSILSDSNLPTGGFVASAGLESFLQHGLLTTANHSRTASIEKSTLLSFIADNLHSYFYLNGPFLKRSHILVERLRNGSEGLNEAVRSVCEIDSEYDSMLLNHVSRRASKAQGVALLTLYSRAFARIPDGSEKLSGGEGKAAQLVETLKAVTRPRVSLEMGLEDVFNGHLPISFGVMCGALELSLGKSACRSKRHTYL